MSSTSIRLNSMKKNLNKALQPELEATNEETIKIMEKIAIDKVDVDAQKEIVQADEAVANEAAMAAKGKDSYLKHTQLPLSLPIFYCPST